MRNQHHLDQLSNLDHLRKVHKNGSLKHLKVFIPVRGNVDNSNLGDVDDMDVSYDCELILYTNLEPPFFEESASHDE